MSFPRNILALDASTELCSVCLTDGTRWIERREHAGQRHSALIIAMVASALQEAGWNVADLDEVAFGEGPGSFTGLRIACGIAQGLAFGAGVPARGVSSLLAIADASVACDPVEDGAAVIAAIDARMNEVYWAAYRRAGISEHPTHRGERVKSVSDTQENSSRKWIEIIPPAVSAATAITLPAGDDWRGAGNAFARYAALTAAMPSRSSIDSSVEVTARAIAALALRGHGTPESPERAAPLYIRDKVALTSAERAAR